MQVQKSLIINTNQIEELAFKYESHLAAFIIENQSVLNIDQLGLNTSEIIGVEIKCGAKNRIDFAIKYDNDCFGIIELKKRELTLKDYNQIAEYLKGSETINKINAKITEKDFEIIPNKSKVIGVLVGDSITTELRRKLEDDKTSLIVAVIIKRYKQENVVYSVTESIASTSKKSKDFSKYKFLNHQELGKSSLVLKVVQYVLSNKSCEDFSEALRLFPDALQNKNVIKRLKEAENNLQNTGYKRYFFDDPIVLSNGEKIVVSNQWGVANIDKFISHCVHKLNIEIKKL